MDPVWIQHCCKSGVNGVVNSETFMYRCVVVDSNESQFMLKLVYFGTRNDFKRGECMKIQVGRGGRRELSLELMLLC